MTRSFQIVEDKIEEAEFFLGKLDFKETDLSKYNIRVPYFYMSAFLSAARSITFCLQASLKGVDGFESWYKEQQEKLKHNRLARYFLDARNFSQKVGYYPIGGGELNKDKDGKNQILLYFHEESDLGPKYVPKTDVVSACKTQFCQLLEIVVSCYKRFGMVIDPEKYYSIENMTENGMTIEDFEIELGYPKGWTKIEGISKKDRIKLLINDIPKVAIDWIFIKYLGTDRYGNQVELNFGE